MAASGGSVLVLNSGSSSVKFALVAAGPGERVLDGLASGSAPRMRRCGSGAPRRRRCERCPPAAARPWWPPSWTRRRPGLIGAGHRVVRGGEGSPDSVLVDNDVIAEIRSFIPLAPLRTRPTSPASRRSAPLRPELPQVAVFDTRSARDRAQRLPLRGTGSGTTGTACAGTGTTDGYRFVSARAAEPSARPLGQLRLVIAHLGNGCRSRPCATASRSTPRWA